MNAFTKLFEQKKVFVSYITAGHGGLAYTEQAIESLSDGGVDIFEIGVPFSDPVADGTAIQIAMNDALKRKVNIFSTIECIKNIKQKIKKPIVLFTYYNLLLVAGVGNILKLCAEAKIEGLLVVDLPIEESRSYFEICNHYHIEPICLLSPSTSNERSKLISEYCNSFLYYVCRNGVTGVQKKLPESFVNKVTMLKNNTNKPIVCGFGIGDKELAAKVLDISNGFVVGSAFVSAINNGAKPNDLQKLAQQIDPRNHAFQ